MKRIMRILTLNMNMFRNVYNEDDFWDYIESVNPDIAFIQEAPRKRFDEKSDTRDYAPMFPKKIENNGDSRHRITIGLSKEKTDVLEYDAGGYDYKVVKRKIGEHDEITISGLHLPIEENTTKNWEKFTDACKADIVCGDFNANLKKTGTRNVSFLEELKKSHIDLWEKGMEKGTEKAFYIAFEKERKAEENYEYRTFLRKTRIDYILAIDDKVELEKIVLDFRTYAFTDHAALIAEVQIK